MANFIAQAMQNALSIKSDPSNALAGASKSIIQSGALALKLDAMITQEEQFKETHMLNLQKQADQVEQWKRSDKTSKRGQDLAFETNANRLAFDQKNQKYSNDLELAKAGTPEILDTETYYTGTREEISSVQTYYDDGLEDLEAKRKTLEFQKNQWKALGLVTDKELFDGQNEQREMHGKYPLKEKNPWQKEEEAISQRSLELRLVKNSLDTLKHKTVKKLSPTEFRKKIDDAKAVAIKNKLLSPAQRTGLLQGLDDQITNYNTDIQADRTNMLKIRADKNAEIRANKTWVSKQEFLSNEKVHFAKWKANATKQAKLIAGFDKAEFDAFMENHTEGVVYWTVDAFTPDYAQELVNDYRKMKGL